jgi:hypothetical protein
MKAFKVVIAAAVFVLFISCEELTDYYLGITQQPQMPESGYNVDFNLIGVLRPDYKGDYNKSFVFVQQIWPALSFQSFSILPDARVVIEQMISADSSVVTEFPLMAPDSLFYDSLYRPAELFNPVAGQKYRLKCEHTDFPSAQGELFFPSQPEIIENSIILEGTNLHLVFRTDSLIKMYDLYLTGPDYSYLVGRIVPGEAAETVADIVLPVNPFGSVLRIFAYDANLAIYIGNSNTSLNFNKYREGFTTLESGYGVFGALNFIEIEL